MENEKEINSEVPSQVEAKVEAPNSMYNANNTQPNTIEEFKQILNNAYAKNPSPLTADQVTQLFNELQELKNNQATIINQTKKEEVKVDTTDEIKY